MWVAINDGAPFKVLGADIQHIEGGGTRVSFQIDCVKVESFLHDDAECARYFTDRRKGDRRSAE